MASTLKTTVGKTTGRSAFGQAHRAQRVSISTKAQPDQAKASPLLMAAIMALTSGMVAGPMVSPPAAYADEASARREAIKAQRKALLAESRAKAEAQLTSTNDREQKRAEADANVERANEERKRLAAERAAAVERAKQEEYAKQVARSEAESVPPL